MDKDKTLQNIANTLYITTQCISPIGLLTGQTGIALFLYKYARYSDNIIYSNLADSLLDKIYDEIDSNIPFFFAEGLSGIGWALNYLINEKYVDADVDVLDEIDDKMREIEKDKFSDDLNEQIPLFSKGLYFAARGLKEDMHNTLNELESFLSYPSIPRLDDKYWNSVSYFLSQTHKTEIDQEKSKYLMDKIPTYGETHCYWQNLLYKGIKHEATQTDINQIDKTIVDIHYSDLSLHNGLAGLGILIL